MSPQTSDAELAEHARRGDADAFSLLAARHKTWLFRFIRRFVGNDADAFDLSQDAMLAAWLSLHAFDTAKPFSAWLRRIALNKCRDWHRRGVLRRLVGLLSSDADDIPAEASRSNPEAMWIASEALQRVDLAIAALPRNLREAFILTAFEGLSHGEAGELLGVSAKSVETRVYRARRRLTSVIARADLALPLPGATTP